MCLDSLRNLHDKSGYGFKVVRYGDTPGEYKGEWRYFAKDGGLIKPEKGCLINRIAWKVGRLYRVKHTRLARVKGLGYPAWVHLFNYLPLGYFGGRNVILVCRYTSGGLTDGTQFTAKRVTPIIVLKTYQDGLKFKELMGWQNSIPQAVKLWPKSQEAV